MRRSSWIVVAFAAGALLVTAAIGSSHRAGNTYFGTLTNHTVTTLPEPSESPEPSPSPEPSEKPEPSPKPEPSEKPEPTPKAEPSEKPDEDETGDHDGIHQNGPPNDNESPTGAAHENGGVGGETKKP